MRWRQVAVLYAVAALLALDYFGVGARPRPGSGAPTETRRPRVFTIDPKLLSEVAIEHRGRRIVARRDGDGWTIAEPPSLAVPSDLVQAFAVAVLDAEEIEHVDAEGDLAAYGLDDGAARVELRPSGGPPETLWIGAANPSDTAVYARRLGTRGVVLVGRTIGYYEELILQALPHPSVPVDTSDAPVG